MNIDEWEDAFDKFQEMEHGGVNLTQEEFECLVSKGFCSLLAMRHPEVLDNKTFLFVTKGLLAIEMLEEQCVGKTYNDFINYIDEKSENVEPADKDLYQAIKKAYTESERNKYLKCKELYNDQTQAQQNPKQPEDNSDPDL